MPTTLQVKQKVFPLFIAIAGGSGAGKTWLATRLQKAFGKEASIVSLDSFYKDRGHLSPAQCKQVNFDHPRAINWDLLKKVLSNFKQGKKAVVPQYDFTTHTAVGESILPSKKIIIIEGLWILRPVWLRKFFSVRIFVDCPDALRRTRRLRRDKSERGRTTHSIRQQFDRCVTPMHEKYVEPQKRWADMALPSPGGKKAVHQLVTLIKSQLPSAL